MELIEKLRNKLDNLISSLKGKKVIVAFSGGIDSSLLAFLSNKHAKETLLITERSVLHPDEEIEDAIKFAQKFDISHKLIQGTPLNNEKFTQNPQNRCYICKKNIFSKLIAIKDEKDYDVIIDGSNYDDLNDYRPGLQALNELNIISPYIKFQINKQEIRKISQYFNLGIESKPSNACFASRIPYNQIITEQKLNMINEGEEFLKKTFGLTQVRVRLHDNMIARIELLKDDIPKLLIQGNLEMITKKFKELRFYYITVDLEGFRSGSMNENLILNKINE
ncbi:MAG: ATP-dependent sacrificial sulfur transferase LarE [Candidatus Hodarchaeota archaeon]